MDVKVSWSVGKEGYGGTRLDRPPFRVFVSWISSTGQLLESQDFSESELREEVSRLKLAGESTSAHESALSELLRA